jgi:hypothetical protein
MGWHVMEGGCSVIPPKIFYWDTAISEGPLFNLPDAKAFPADAPEGSVGIKNTRYAPATATVAVTEKELARFEFPASNAKRQSFWGTSIAVTPSNPQGDFIYVSVDHPTDGIKERFTTWDIMKLMSPSFGAAMKDFYEQVLFVKGAWNQGFWDYSDVGLDRTTIVKNCSPGVLTNCVFITQPVDVWVTVEVSTAAPGAVPFNVLIMSHGPHLTRTDTSPTTNVRMWRMTNGSWVPQTVGPFGTFQDIRNSAMLMSGDTDPNVFIWAGAASGGWLPARDHMWYADSSSPATTMFKP